MTKDERIPSWMTQQSTTNLDTDNDQVGACRALWLLNGGQTEQWNGIECDCEIIQGVYNCKLNPF